MIAISIIVSFCVIFVAGMHYAVWDQLDQQKSLYWCIALSLIGIYNLISLVGAVARVYQ